jgi:hypothetical protein
VTDKEREELELLRAFYVNAKRLEKMHRRNAEPPALNGAPAPNPLAKEITK